MIIYIIFLIWFLFVLESFRKRRIEALFLDYKYRLYALRDELRELVLKGEIKNRNWVFLYLDSSIVRTINYIHKLNIYQGLFLFFMHREDNRVIRAREQLLTELQKPCNLELKRIHEKYGKILGCFMFERHRALSNFALITFVISYITKKKWEEFLETITELPETSTITHVSPA